MRNSENDLHSAKSIQYQHLLADAIRELKAQKKQSTWPDHIVAQSAMVVSEATKLQRLALEIKYKGKDTSELDKAIISIIAVAIRFKENLK